MVYLRLCRSQQRCHRASAANQPSAKLKKQKLHKMVEEQVEVAMVEVWRLLDAGFIREVKYPKWLANIVMVRKKMESGECVHTLQT
jgi:hypothetical protein